ncbi:MAG TPA: hypothetical protein DEO82_00370, partial [Eubacterium sp.]|nr:hypothetical protein [Eubacterium sp.]
FSFAQSAISLISEIPNDMVKSTLMHELDIDYFLKVSDYFESMEFFETDEGITIVDGYLTKLASDLDNLPKKYPEIMAKYDNHNLTGKLATSMKTSLLKIPKNVRKFLVGAGDVVEYAGYVCIIGDTIKDSCNDLKALSVLDAQYSIYEDYEDMLLIMSSTSKNKYNKDALLEIRNAMKDEEAKRDEKIIMIAEDIIGGGVEGLINIGVGEIGMSNPLVWGIALGISIGDAIFNVGNTDEKAMYTISIGDSANALRKITSSMLSDKMFDYNQKYYKVDDKTYMYLSALCQFRIISENLFYDMSDSAVIKVNKGKIKSDIKSNIRIVIGIIKDNDFSAIANYNGAKVYVN